MNKTLKYIILVGLFIIPFIPLFIANSLFFPFITGKNFAFRIIIEIISASWIILALTDKAYWPKKSWIMYAFGIFIIIMALADAFGAYPYKSFWSNNERMEGWITLAHLFAYFIVAATMLSKEKLWDAFWQTQFGVNLVIVLYSILQIRHLLTINQGGVRVDATFGNATYLAIYVLFNIFLAGLYLVRRSNLITTFQNWYWALGFNAGFLVLVLPNLKNATVAGGDPSSTILWGFFMWIVGNVVLYLTVWAKQEKITYGLLIILNLIALYNTATRGAIIGLIGGIGLAALLIAIFEKERTTFRKTSIGVIIAALVLVGGFLLVRKTSFVQNSPVLSRFASISPTETTTLSRFKLWAMAFKGFKERPILGWGQESFNYVFNKYYNPQLYNQEQWFDRTHDIIFDWLIAGGILGLASYLFFFGSVVFYVWKADGEGSFTITERAILTGLMAAYFIHNLFVFDNLTSYLIFISIAAYVYYRTTKQYEYVSEPKTNRVILPVAVVALIVALYGLNIRPIMANRTLIQAISIPDTATDVTSEVALFQQALSYNTFSNSEIREQLMARADQYASAQSTTPVTGESQLISLAVDEGKKQVAATPNDARYYVFLGSLLARTGDTADGITYLTKATQLSPNKQTILFALAGAYLANNDYKDAETWLKQAFDADPSYDDARLTYAAATIYNNEMTLAHQLLSPLSTSTIANSTDVLQALYTAKQYNELIPLWQEKISEDPSAQNHVYLASVYLSAGNKKAAIAEIQAAIKIEPDFQTQGEEYIKEINSGQLK